MSSQQGMVYLVGAGPGDPGLITLRGVECLGRADVVLYDYLVNPRVLEHVGPGAELVCLGRHGHGRILSQSEINERAIRDAQTGRVVVRLKSGDPTIFARAAEEIGAFLAAGVPFEIVPGITAAMATASYAGIPLTGRDQASAIALVTGQEGDDKQGLPLDLAALGKFPGTLVFYMGVTTAPHWSAALIAAGKSPATPVAVVRRCSWPDQWTLRTTLGELPRMLTEHKVRPPVVAIVGQVAAAQGTTGWFARRPLFGRTVLITRPIDQIEPLRTKLEELGARTLVQPAIKIGKPADWRRVDDAIARIGEFDWLVFSSANGVRAFLDRLLQTGDMRRLARAKLAAIGPATAAELRRYHLHCDIEPEQYRAESLVAALAPQAKGMRFLLARASRGREVLREELERAGATVEQVVVYRSTDVEAADPEVLAELSAGRVDWTTATSSAIARSMTALLGDHLRQTRLISISPLTSETLRQAGFEPAAEATVYTTDGVIAALLRAEAT
ncbi:MAG: uroporphyrinogen-III C-methyltransferase [Pirellulales bacterium]|nr:uroporphyrinogen-III C-methyltransferase [Pirellulales bacterium]